MANHRFNSEENSLESNSSFRRSNSLSSNSSQDSWSSRRKSSSLCDSTNFANELCKPHDAFIKVITLGESAVGKSSLMSRILDGAFQLGAAPTIGIDFGLKMVDIDGKRVKMQMWDTAGQERFRTITQAYIRGADCVYLVFDVTSSETFSKLKYWLRNLRKYDPDNLLPKILVGNKTDLVDKRAVPREVAEEYANSLGIEYFETSALDFSDSIGVSMECLLRQALTRKSLLPKASNDEVIELSTGAKMKRRFKNCC